MSAHPPPVPPDQRPRKGADPEAPKGEAAHHPERDSRNRDPDQQGQPANTKQNTTNQGYQQDR